MNAAEHWAVFFGYLTDKAKRGKINEIIESEEGIAMASEVLMTISRDEVERARLNSELKWELDTQSKITYARQEERKTWQGIIANKDNEIANKDNEIARLRAELEKKN